MREGNTPRREFAATDGWTCLWSSHPAQDAVSLTRKEQGQAP